MTEAAMQQKQEPPAMLDMLIMQLEGALSSFPAPEYVKEAGGKFIESLKRWKAEGK